MPTYIVKPDCGSQGEGIYLVNDPRDVQDAIGLKPAVVQVSTFFRYLQLGFVELFRFQNQKLLKV